MNYSINNNHNTERTFYARLYFVYAENLLMTESEASDYACNHVDDDDPMAALIDAGDMSMWTFDEVAQYVANSRDPISVSDRTKKFLADVNVYKTAKYYYKHWDTRHELYMYSDDGFKLATAEAEAYNEFKDDGEEKICYGVTVNLPIYEKSRRTYNWRNGASTPVEYDLGNPFGDDE